MNNDELKQAAIECLKAILSNPKTNTVDYKHNAIEALRNAEALSLLLSAR